MNHVYISDSKNWASKKKFLLPNPAHDCIFYPKQQSLFNQKKKKAVKPILEAEISLANIHDTIQLSSPFA